VSGYKLKVKTGPIETRCQETDRGLWRFVTGDLEWQYTEGRLGLNLAVRRAGTSDDWVPLIYAKNLDGAVYFAQGYEGGRSLKVKTD